MFVTSRHILRIYLYPLVWLYSAVFHITPHDKQPWSPLLPRPYSLSADKFGLEMKILYKPTLNPVLYLKCVQYWQHQSFGQLHIYIIFLWIMLQGFQANWCDCFVLRSPQVGWQVFCMATYWLLVEVFSHFLIENEREKNKKQFLAFVFPGFLQCSFISLLCPV